MKVHDIKIIPNDTTGETDYVLRVVCSCQWQALARCEEHAEIYKRNHLIRQGAISV